MSQTVFVAGGSGFIGLEFCRACVAAGYTVLALCRSEAAVRRVEALGARAVKGDLLQPGAWQGVARRAGQVVQLAQPPLVFGRMSAQQAWKYNRERKAMDVNLLGALDSRGVARVLYVSGACYYGNLGPDLHDEAATPRPRGVGRLAAGGVLRVSHYLEAGLPIVTAFPGCVYGVGSWFEQLFLTPLFRRRRVVDWGDVVRSHIHVRDCGRALVHLLRHGAVGERYFLVDDEPTSWTGLQVVTARALDVTPRVTRVPVWLVGALMGRIMAECMGTSFALSNARLKALGFALQYPTIDTGVPALLAQGSACGQRLAAYGAAQGRNSGAFQPLNPES